MIQILGLRDYFNKRTDKQEKAERFFEKGWRAESVPELFANIDSYISNIPEGERWNLYYTAGHCLEKKGRILERQNIIPIDIDNIDETKIDLYIEVTLQELGLKYEETGIVFSGNGLQFIIGISDSIDDESYFDEHRVYYKALCGNIAIALYNRGLLGDVDPSVFSRGRLLRLPNTKNIKPKKGTKQARMLQSVIKEVPFDLIAKSAVPVVDYNQQVGEEMLKRLPPPDAEGVQTGCDFLIHCKENQATISEPEWYAMLSVIGRLENGNELAHEYSREHPEYSEHNTNRKMQQSIEASGPRTCDNISSLWEGCITCVNYQKCKSPIVLQSSEYIKSKDNGFYDVSIDKNGLPKQGKPNYDDLMKYFTKKHPFVTMTEGSMTYIWNKTHWTDYPVAKMNQFSEEHFDPKPTQVMCNEFKAKLQRNNLQETMWFDNQGLLNFQNGVLDMDSMVLSKHSINVGFKYVLPFEYNPLEICPRFDAFLEEITCGDSELQTVLLEFMGYSLSGIDAAIGQKALILTGDGSNGKSVFMDVLKHLAGKDNYATLSMGQEIAKLENRYQLDGKLFNISEETPTNAMMDNSIFKAIVAGGEVQARKLYCDAYSMKNNAKIIMACNSLPNTKDTSHGMFRRLLIVPFKAKFDRMIEGYDPMIRDKLYAESAGIFNKVLIALQGFKERKQFADSVSVEKQIEDYRNENDGIKAWWEDVMVEEADIEIPMSTIYMAYKMDCEDGSEKPKALPWFSQRLKRLIGESGVERKRVQGRRISVIKGWKQATGEGENAF